MADNWFFNITSGLTFLMMLDPNLTVRVGNYEGPASRAHLTVNDKYRVDLTHTTNSTIKVRLYEGSRGSMRHLQPRLNQLSELGLKWEHYAGTITAVATFRIDSVSQSELETVLIFLNRALDTITEVPK